MVVCIEGYRNRQTAPQRIQIHIQSGSFLDVNMTNQLQQSNVLTQLHTFRRSWVMFLRCSPYAVQLPSYLILQESVPDIFTDGR